MMCITYNQFNMAEPKRVLCMFHIWEIKIVGKRHLCLMVYPFRNKMVVRLFCMKENDKAITKILSLLFPIRREMPFSMDAKTKLQIALNLF